MKRALFIGIDAYENYSQLAGCVGDATKMYEMLKRNEDNTRNYECRLYTSEGPKPITREFLKNKWNELFRDFTEEILFYFSGHGALTQTSTHITTQDGNSIIPGLDMDDLLKLVNQSRAREIVLILDCCYGGALGSPDLLQGGAVLDRSLVRENVTILAAASPKGLAMEIEGSGVFTGLLLGALGGGAADVRGNVSAASIYAYVDQALGAWDQRPIYKSYANKMSTIRRCIPHVSDDVLQDLPSLFPEKPDTLLHLNPSYERTHKSMKKDKVEIFDKLKTLRDARLLRTVNGEDLYYAALESKPVQLTPLGQFYWRLANDDKL